MSRIDDLVEAYPNVDLATEDTKVVQEIALRWLDEHSKALARGGVRSMEKRYTTAEPTILGLPVRRDIDQERYARDSATANAVNSIVRAAAPRLNPDWSADFRLETFTVPGKGMITWGDATIEDHVVRQRFLESQSAGVLETASRHQRAIDDLYAAGKRTLNELVAAA